MSNPLTLHRITLDGEVAEIERATSGAIGLETLTSLHQHWRNNKAQWTKPEESDRWLAPRFHYAMRLTRAEASDRGVWHWLASDPWADYVRWRWSAGGTKDIAADRIVGPVHKQALARLWWGGELLRDGADYSTVAAAFVNQDLPNSLLHRPVMRCRSLAVAIVSALKADPRGTESDRINGLARVLNLCTAGSPPEARVAFQSDDTTSYLNWVAEQAVIPDSWSAVPSGPPSNDTTSESLALGAALAQHGLEVVDASGAPP